MHVAGPRTPIDLLWDDPLTARGLRRLALFSRRSPAMAVASIQRPRRGRFVGVSSGRRGGEEGPGSWDSFEGVVASVLEGDSRAGDEVGDGPGGEDLPRASMVLDSLADVDGDAADVAAAYFDFAGVNANAHLDTEVGGGLVEGEAAGDGPAGAVEGGQEAVSGGFDLVSSVALEVLAYEVVVGVEQFMPAAVPELACLFGGSDDVTEQHRGQHPVWGRCVAGAGATNLVGDVDPAGALGVAGRRRCLHHHLAYGRHSRPLGAQLLDRVAAPRCWRTAGTIVEVGSRNKS